MEMGLPRGPETVLLVDDEEMVRQSTARILESLGYKVLQAATPDQALQLATLSNPHLLLVDVVLPQMSGLKLAQKIATTRPIIRILYFSAYTSDEVLEAESPNQALILAENEPIDLVVMDVVMPRQTGPEVARRMAGLRKDVCILFVSGQAPEELVREQDPGGAELHFLQKPFTSHELGAAVRDALDGPP